MTSLHRLARQGDVEGLRRVIDVLPDPRRSVNELDERDCSPLFYAVSAEKPVPDLVRALLETGADPNFERVQQFDIPNVDWDEFNASMIEQFPDLEGMDLSDVSDFAQPRREAVVKQAIQGPSVEVVRLLHEFGADLGYRDDAGYNAILNAVFAPGDRLPMVRYLIGLGLDVRAVSAYGETAIYAAYRSGGFPVVAELLKAGADESLLGWKPLHRAIAIGTLAEVESELAQGAEIGDKDGLGQSPLLVALHRGDDKIVQLLLAHGAEYASNDDDRNVNLTFAIRGGNPALVKRVLELGVSIDELNLALKEAVEHGDLAIVRLVLEAGADPKVAPQYSSSIFESAKNREMILLLSEFGGDLQGLNTDGRRILVGLTDRPELEGISREMYFAGRDPIEGSSNPQPNNDPFQLAMIRAGWSGYGARSHFGDELNFSCNRNGRAASPFWSFDRFGQSTTILPDGRIVLIAGEHEDGGDPDFCIYNDVAVFGPDGAIKLFAYPYAVFPPTDFHTATLVGKWIYIIGSLGYMGTRGGPIPVFRLSTQDFHIEPVATNGELPPRIYEHRARLVDERFIEIEGGTRLKFLDEKEGREKNQDRYRLDLETLSWARI